MLLNKKSKTKKKNDEANSNAKNDDSKSTNVNNNSNNIKQPPFQSTNQTNSIVNTNHNLNQNQPTPSVSIPPTHTPSKPILPPTRSFQLLEPLKNTSQNIIKTSSNEDNSTLSSSNSKNDQYISFDISISNDPFNEMELKTINDIEELKTILHNHQMEQQQQHQQHQQQHIQAQQQYQLQDVNSTNSSITNTNHLISNHGSSITTTNQLDNFGLPKISFVDFDINSNKLK